MNYFCKKRENKETNILIYDIKYTKLLCLTGGDTAHNKLVDVWYIPRGRLGQAFCSLILPMWNLVTQWLSRNLLSIKIT